MSVAEIIALLQDIVLAGAALTGAIVAVKGLSAWKRQLRGHADYDLSRRLLVTLFRYRDSLNAVRHPVMWAEEMPVPPPEEAKKMSLEKESYYGTSGAYHKRWDAVREQRAALYADTLEAEALWGNELRLLLEKLFDLEHELGLCIRYYLESINPDVAQARREATLKIREKRRDVLYDDLSKDGDEYKKDVMKAITKIESYLKPKLTSVGP